MKKYVRELVESNCRALVESGRTLEDIFNIMFSRPDEIMAEWLENGRKCSMTFGEGEKAVRNAAYVLKEMIGDEAGFVALDMENSVRWIISFWAIIMCGAKPYLVNRRHPARLTRGIVSTLKITFAVAEGETGYPCIFIDAKELETQGHDDFGRDGSLTFADEIALSTSATTMNEIICIYDGQRIASQILNCKGILMQNSLMPEFYHGALKQLAFLPFYHIFGLMAVYFWFAFFARPMVFMEDYSADSILNTVKQLEVTHIFAVPLLWHMIEKQVRTQVHARGEKQEKKFLKGLEISVKIQKAAPKLGRKIAKSLLKEVTDQLFGRSPVFLISGGGYIRDSAMYLFNALGYPLHNGYGMSETGITSVELRENITARLENSIGKPFDNVKYSVTEDGVLQIGSSSMCCRMIRNGQTIEVGDTYDSGDIVYADENGNYYIRGRLGDRIIGESGENVNPDEIEKDLEFPLARNYCVFGDGESSEEEIALVIQLARDMSSDEIKETAQAAYTQSDALESAYRIRKYYFTFDPICAETAIKVSRVYLKRGIADGSIRIAPFEDVLEGRVSGREAVSDDNELGITVRDAFSEFIDRPVEEICMDDHFIYDLGGTSLDYFSLVMRINELAGIRLSFDKESACYTVREFCRVIEKTR